MGDINIIAGESDGKFEIGSCKECNIAVEGKGGLVGEWLHHAGSHAHFGVGAAKVDADFEAYH